MTVADLIERLRKLPETLEVEIQIHDPVKDIRLWADTETVEQVGDTVDIYGRHVAV